MKFNATPLSLNIIQLLATGLSTWYVYTTSITEIHLIEIIVGYFLLSCIGNSIFYHRYISHNSFKTYKIIEIIGITCGMLAGKGSPMDWAGIHRYHHKHADTKLDPHNPRLEGWKLFFPYLLQYDNKINPFIVKDLLRSKTYRFLSEYYILIIAIFAVVFAIINFQLFMCLWVIPMTLTTWVLGLIVYVAHMYGYRNFDTKDNSTNNWLMSIILFGEGWHNNHHHAPGDYNFKRNWWEIDIGGLIIKLIKK